jgi:outer membrane protein
MRRTTIYVLLLFFGTNLARGQSQQFTLKEAQKYAIEHNKTVQGYKIDKQITEKKIKEVLSIGLPQVNGEGSFQHFIDLPTSVIPANAFDPSAPEDLLIPVKFGTDFNMSASITASQLLFDGSYFIGLKAARMIPQLSQLGVEKSEQEIKDEVAKAYYNVVVADENVRVLKASLENSENLLKDTKVFLDSKQMRDSTNYEQMQLLVSNLKNSISRAERLREIAVRVLKLNMGIPQAQSVEISESLTGVMQQVNYEELMSKTFSAGNHVDHKMLQTQIQLDEMNLKNEKARILPSLGAFYTHQEQSFGNNFSFSNSWYPANIWGLNLKVPIWGSGTRAARMSQAKLQMEKNELLLTQVDEGLTMQAETAKLNFTTAYEVFNTEKENLALAQRIQDRTLKKSDLKTIGRMELTQVQNQYLQTEGNYILAMMELLNAKAALDKILNNY